VTTILTLPEAEVEVVHTLTEVSEAEVEEGVCMVVAEVWVVVPVDTIMEDLHMEDGEDTMTGGRGRERIWMVLPVG